MVPRPTARRERNNDYSAVGTAGRRTGVTLPPGKLDENGLEEITGLFSSPTKSLPVKQNLAASGDDARNSMLEASEDMVGMDSSGLTPTQTLSARRSTGAPALPRSRSASPRKSGINGTPRRSNGIDIRSPSKAAQPIDVEDRENSESPTPIRVKPRRFAPSPEKRVLNEVVPNGTAIGSDGNYSAEKPINPIVTREVGAGHNENIQTKLVPDGRPLQPDSTINHTTTGIAHDEDAIPNPIGDDEMEEIMKGIEDTLNNVSPVPDSASLSPGTANDRVAERISIPKPADKPTTSRDNGRKRKSQELGEESAAASLTKPAKKPRAAKAGGPKAKAATKTTLAKNSPLDAAAAQSHKQPVALRQPGLDKDVNTHLSQRQQAELDQIIEKVKARPGKLKSLYVLKRVKPKKSGADDVRSGRAVVKPLAYWSAEQCVYNNISDGAAGLELGARIPLGSIKEITDVTAKNTKGEAVAANEDSDSDGTALHGAHQDGHEEAWEKEIGVFRGQAAVWSQPDQTSLEDVLEETDLAYHPSTMLTREVKDSGFRYAKLISLPFFGSGIVDLPPGTIKRPKNSRMMHLCFFVFTGRVTVNIGLGIEEGECERFSIGKGGVFQVPRGNWYSIENVLEKPARIFFSQASETAT